jgi:uncharacterized protein YdhG (YjbR/CyaY superfamily)
VSGWIFSAASITEVQMATATKPSTRLAAGDVENYFAMIPAEARATLESLRATIRTVVPKAVEVIWYQIPTFKLNDRPLVAIAAFKNHCSLFLMSTALLKEYKDELGPYLVSKGTLRFEIGKPVPATLIKKLVKARIKDVVGQFG